MWRGLRRGALVVSVLLLSGCALPLPIKIASWAIDGISYIATEKTITDHGISAIAGRDCAMMRAVTKGQICDTETAATVVVDAGTGPNALSDDRAVDIDPETIAPTIAPTVVAFVAPASALGRNFQALPAELEELQDRNLGMFPARGLGTSIAANLQPVDRAGSHDRDVENFETAAGPEESIGEPVTLEVSEDGYTLPEGRGMVDLWQIGMAPNESDSLAAVNSPAARPIETENVVENRDAPEGPALLAMWNGDTAPSDRVTIAVRANSEPQISTETVAPDETAWDVAINTVAPVRDTNLVDAAQNQVATLGAVEFPVTLLGALEVASSPGDVENRVALRRRRTALSDAVPD